MSSDLTRRGGFLLTKVMIKWLLPIVAPVAIKLNPNGMFRPTWKSADDAIRLCFEVDVPKGELVYLNGTDNLETGREAKDEEKRRELWSYGLEVAQIKQTDTVLRDWQ